MEKEQFLQRLKKAWNILTNKNYKRTAEYNQLLDFLGISKDLNDSELKEATYFGCMKVLSECMGKLPLKVMQHTEKTGTLSKKEHRFYRVLLKRPNPYMTASTFWGLLELWRNHYGNAYAFIDQRIPECPQLYPLDPTEVTIYFDDAKLLADVPDVYYNYTHGTCNIVLKSQEVLHFKNFMTRDGITGIPTRDMIGGIIEGAVKSQNVQNNLYQSGMTAKAVLQYTGSLNDDNVKALKDGITAYASGSGGTNSGGIIPIPLGFTLTPLNIKLTDSQFLELKQYSALQIASAFGIKPDQIGDYTKSSYANSESQQISFLVDTMLFIIKQYEEEIEEKLLTENEIQKGYTVKFNTRVLMRVDQFTQINSISTAISNFLYMPNEGREFLDMSSVDGGNQLIGNGGTIPLQMVGEQYRKDGEKSENDSEKYAD
ncbi:MAG: phage portal protein [Oscillospiraceae bacterium]|nr:phage portal protein [Oscillospiraceae bacterium]